MATFTLTRDDIPRFRALAYVLDRYKAERCPSGDGPGFGKGNDCWKNRALGRAKKEVERTAEGNPTRSAEFRKRIAQAEKTGEDERLTDAGREKAAELARKKRDEKRAQRGKEKQKLPDTGQESEPKKSLFGEEDFPQESPAGSPRDAAATRQRELDEDYEFARKSEIPNAGEDLKGSARHKVNEWRSLAQAEADGTAEAMVTRDMLLKTEPHELSSHAEHNPIVALLMHEAIRAFPKQPGYKNRGGGAEDRKQYLDAYRAIKSEAEKIAASDTSDPLEASRKLNRAITEEIRRLRSVGGRYDNTANSLVGLSNKLSSSPWSPSAILKKVGEFALQIKSQHEGADPADLRQQLADATLSVMEGKSMNAVLGTKKEGGNTKERFNVAELYVSIAERKGGPKLPATTATGATAYMVDSVGLRGVQFGQSVSDAERKHHAVKAAESMLDLSDITGLPIEAISLNGRLGLAMGARGKGGALAHYEPDSQVINLTRKSGVGSLAHEWGHAFDHAINGFGLARGIDGKVGGDYESERTSSTRAVYKEPGNPRSGVKVENGKLVTEDLSKDPVWSTMNDLRQSWVSSGYSKRLGQRITDLVREGKMSEKKRDYWRSKKEMFARCFERYIQRKLEKSDRQNTYLAGISTKAYKSGGLWPTNEEVDQMIPAFDALMDAYRKEKLGVAERAKYSRDFRREFIARYAGSSSPDRNSRRAALLHVLRG